MGSSHTTKVIIEGLRQTIRLEERLLYFRLLKSFRIFKSALGEGKEHFQQTSSVKIICLLPKKFQKLHHCL